MRTMWMDGTLVAVASAERLVGKAKAAGAPARVVWVALLAATLTATGCGTPFAAAPEVEEGRVTFRKAPPKAGVAAAKAAGGVVAPMAGVAGGVRPGQVTTAAPAAAPGGAGPRLLPTPAVGAVAILEAPATGVRMFPLMAGDVLDDARFAPADGTLAWKLRAPADGVRVATVRIQVEGGAAPVTAEGPPADFALPARIAGDTTVRANFALVDTMQALASDPTARELRATYTFIGPDGGSIVGPDGAPLALSARIDVQ